MVRIDNYRTRDVEWVYQRDSRRYRIPEIEEQEKKDLVQRAKQGNREAVDMLVRSHLGLIEHIARESHRRGRIPDYMDLVQEGALILFRAIQGYDPAIGDFTPYIQRGINRGLRKTIGDQKSTIRINQKARPKIRFVENLIADYRNNGVDFSEDDLILALAFRHLRKGLERDPTPEEIQKHLLYKPNELTTLQTYRRLIEYALGAHIEFSLDDVREEIEDTEFTLGKERERDIESAKEARGAVNNALRKIAPRDAKVVELRHGLDDQEVYTLREIGDMFDPPVSRTRVDQIEKRGLINLKIITSGKGMTKTRVDTSGSKLTDSRIKNRVKSPHHKSKLANLAV